MRLKSIALLVVAMLLVVGPVAAVAAAGVGDRSSDEGWRWDARYWWEVPPVTPFEREQIREIMVHIFDRYYRIDVSAMSPAEFEELGNSIGAEREKEVLRLFEHYAEKRGFQMPPGILELPGEIPVPPLWREREEFISPANATYWWEFVAPQYREARIAMAKIDIPEMLRYYWERAKWKGVELPLPRPEELDVMRLTPEEYRRIFTPPVFPLGRRSVEEYIERVFPGANIIAVFGRIRLHYHYDRAGWFDRLLEVKPLLLPFCPDLVNRFGVSATGINDAGYIEVWLDCRRLTVEEAQLIARELYAKIAAKAEMVGIEDIPVVFILEAVIVKSLSLPKEPRDHLGTSLPLDQNFCSISGGAQRAIDADLATIGFQ